MIIINLFMNLILLISMLLMTINYISSKKKNNDREKLSAFECGFDPLSSSRLPFSIQFYLISIIFLIFDVEIIIFFPMIPAFNYTNIEFNFFTILYFIMILLIGLYIEWNDGALMWLK